MVRADEKRPDADVPVLASVTVVSVSESDDLTAEESHTETDEYHPNKPFDGSDERRRKPYAEQEEGEAERHDGERVADTPRGADERGGRLVAVDECRHGCDVVGLDRVASPEQSPGDERGDK